jgi:DMSO/TMAO reductase YedYZ molybdopterin-dependent catalytic subunit
MTYVILLEADFMYKQHKNLVVLLLGFILLFAVLAPAIVLASTALQITDLEEVEIREYEGENLSAINAFQENSISGPQYIDIENYTLAVTGLVDSPQEYTYQEVISNNFVYRKVVTIYCVEGWKATILWEGVLVKDLIAEAQAQPNATIVIFYAYDGYSTSLPLDYIIENDIMLAYKMNNVTLPPERGYPFELVAESQWGYKWIKWVTAIELSDNKMYLGYWESRGYPNNAGVGNYPETVDFKDYSDPPIPEFSNLVIVLLATGTVGLVLRYSYKKSKKHNNQHQ